MARPSLKLALIKVGAKDTINSQGNEEARVHPQLGSQVEVGVKLMLK